MRDGHKQSDSCPLDEPHLWEALRYTELNHQRAGLVPEAESWPWSSAASHCGTEPADDSLDRAVHQFLPLKKGRCQSGQNLAMASGRRQMLSCVAARISDNALHSFWCF
jgi:hypothetical protein